jgi:hypothetical protein
MTRRQTRKTGGFLFLAFLALTGIFLFPTSCTAVTRGEVVQIVVDALGLPLWGGKERFADVPPTHPRAKAIETASALGILLRGIDSPTTSIATRAEALGFAFLAMGWRRECDSSAPSPPISTPNSRHLAAFIRSAVP